MVKVKTPLQFYYTTTKKNNKILFKIYNVQNNTVEIEKVEKN